MRGGWYDSMCRAMYSGRHVGAHAFLSMRIFLHVSLDRIHMSLKRNYRCLT